MAVTVERAELASEVRRLRDEEGMLFREIQAALGISYSYAQALYSDPDGAKQRMCLKHKTEAQEQRRSSPSPTRSTDTNSYTARVRALAPTARALDKAKRKLASNGTSETLRAEFQEAVRRAGGVATPENLERVEQAAKKLRRGAPAREKAIAAHADAERAFKVALAEIARDFRA